MNYYILLGVPQDADVDTIRSAFRALARRYHPDAGEGSSVERFREILTAYETLNDPLQRRRYDRTLKDARASKARLVEPLRARAAPGHLDQLIEELFQSWDEMFFGLPRRGGRG